MLAHHHFGHKQLHGKNTSQMQDMLMEKCDINWNDVSRYWKRGTYVQRQKTTEAITEEFLASLPEKARAQLTRSRVVVRDLPPLTKIVNRMEVVFDGDAVIIENLPENL